MVTANAKAVSKPRSGWSARLRKGLKVRGRAWQLYLMLIPAVVYILVCAYKPMGGIVIAFKNYNMRLGIWASEWTGLDNFLRLFRSYWFPVILKNTLSISLLSLVLGFPFPILLALMFNEVEHKGLQQTLQTVGYAPHFISTAVICGMLTLFLSPTNGIVNIIIQKLGGESVFFLQDPAAFKWIYVVSGIWQSVGWSSIIYFAALSGVDKSLHEAAEIDGANRIQKIIHINLPVLVPTIVVLLILQCGQLLSLGYEKVYLLQTKPNLSGSEVISTYVYKVGLEQMDFAFSTATGIFNSVVNSAILIIANTVSSKVSKSALW